MYVPLTDVQQAGIQVDLVGAGGLVDRRLIDLAFGLALAENGVVAIPDIDGGGGLVVEILPGDSQYATELLIERPSWMHQRDPWRFVWGFPFGWFAEVQMNFEHVAVVEVDPRLVDQRAEALRCGSGFV